jgi:hypothetical protein
MFRYPHHAHNETTFTTRISAHGDDPDAIQSLEAALDRGTGMVHPFGRVIVELGQVVEVQNDRQKGRELDRVRERRSSVPF